MNKDCLSDHVVCAFLISRAAFFCMNSQNDEDLRQDWRGGVRGSVQGSAGRASRGPEGDSDRGGLRGE